MQSKDKIYDLIIIGAGPAGLSAGLYAQRFEMDYKIIGQVIGGTANEAVKVENYPGFKSISGHKLMQKIVEQINQPIIKEKVSKIKLKNNQFIIITGEKKYTSKTIIIATGGKPRKLNIKGEEKFLGKGISYCFTCDGPLFKNKIVAVVGGGNAGLTASLSLSKIAKKVYLIHRGENFSPGSTPKWQQDVRNNKKIELIFNANVIQAQGKQTLNKIKLDNGQSLELDGLFIEIGIVPNIALIQDIKVKTEKHGDACFIKVNQNQQTNVPGIFAAGDITNQPVRQIITSCGQGAMAVISAQQYLKENY